MKNYIAYGSNLNIAQMAHRCPNSRIVATGILKNYRLVFRGVRGNAHATVEPQKGSSVPVAIWKVPVSDERNLDIYEGFPAYYFKKTLKVDLPNGKKMSGMIYLMDLARVPNTPSVSYINTIATGYQDCNLDINVFLEALQFNSKEVREKKTPQ